MKADGLDPLPTYIPPLEDPQTRPELAGDSRCNCSARRGPSS